VGLSKAELVKWTKGFSCTGVEGEDVVALLREAIHRRDDVDIDVAALLNDTTGPQSNIVIVSPGIEPGYIVFPSHK
jgi:hexokinase